MSKKSNKKLSLDLPKMNAIVSNTVSQMLVSPKPTDENPDKYLNNRFKQARVSEEDIWELQKEYEEEGKNNEEGDKDEEDDDWNDNEIFVLFSIQ